MRCACASLSGLLLWCAFAESVGAAEVITGRYTIVDAAPSAAQANPLETVIEVALPRQTVSTVGDAIRYVLLRTGYQLAGTEELDARVQSFMRLPLPEVQRRLGPCTVQAALSILMGHAFSLGTDPLRRVINYSVASPQSARRTGTDPDALSEISRIRPTEAVRP